MLPWMARDSKGKAGTVLVFTPHEWSAFVEVAKAGTFDQS
ncbi:DUF397 domain-containing protein [Planosporangium thailandense]|uniref:DUF397 domain-containing protein n=1 Tax=Planosporangium thailandense TaxID=765197 RepID=A0ABX0XYE1_9ACTN|nr:DUF397 domain-containing protein [Planosporangium thailandense]